MKNNFNKLSQSLKIICNKFDQESCTQKKQLICDLLNCDILVSKHLIELQNTILFISAHPSDLETVQLVDKLKEKCTDIFKSKPYKFSELENSGLPFTKTVSTFSHDMIKWLLGDKKVEVKFDSFYNASLLLKDALLFTLPAMEKEVTTFDFNNEKLLKELKVENKNKLPFLISEFDKLNDVPFIKDYFFNALGVYIQIKPKEKAFSKFYNKLSFNTIFYQTEIIKQFDQQALLDKKLPAPKRFNENEFNQSVSTIKDSLTLLQRETDPVTYIDEKSFRLYELERGISVAIFEIIPERQLPLESYVGYTLFKNGYPAAYGGAWILGKRALFGINIFEQFRGGESGFVMCQLLRVYRQAFSIDYFEVEPYQYGKDNPEGINSGAFWFYFRFGFRLLNEELNTISLKEFEKIKSDKAYRTSKEILKNFTESNIVLNLGKLTPLTIAEIRNKVANYISENHQGNRLNAEKAVLKKFNSKLKNQKTTIDFAFLVEVLNIKSKEKLKTVENAIEAKSNDLYVYQKLMRKIL